MPTALIGSPGSIVEDVLSSLRRTTAPKVARQESGEGWKERILILEETPDLGQTIEFVLTAKRYQASYRPNNVAAVSYAKQFRPQAILLNLGGPRRTGIHTCRALRSAFETAKCAIVMMTLEQPEGYERAVFEAGATMFVPKKLDVRSLLMIIEDALKSNR